MLINIPLIDTKLYVHKEICWRESVCFTAVEVAETSNYRNEKLTPSLSSAYVSTLESIQDINLLNVALDLCIQFRCSSFDNLKINKI